MLNHFGVILQIIHSSQKAAFPGSESPVLSDVTGKLFEKYIFKNVHYISEVVVKSLSVNVAILTNLFNSNFVDRMLGEQILERPYYFRFCPLCQKYLLLRQKILGEEQLFKF